MCKNEVIGSNSSTRYRLDIFTLILLKNCNVWSSLVEGDEELYLPNCQTNLVIALHALSLLFCIS